MKAQDLRKWRKGTGSGWRGESIRHGLAARGINTANKSQRELELIRARLSQIDKQRKEQADLAKNALSDMRAFLRYMRKGKGRGSSISPDDFRQRVREARVQSIKLNGRYDKEITKLEKQFKFYEKVDFFPARIMRTKKLTLDVKTQRKEDIKFEKKRLLELEKEKAKFYSATKVSFQKPEEGRVYPITPVEAKKVLDNDVNAKNLKEIRFTNPKDKFQNDAYAQYVRRDRRINIYSQPAIKAEGKTYFVEKTELIRPSELNHVIKYKVLPHEAAHHRILYKDRITDKRVETAEARAEALRHGKNYKDAHVVKRFEHTSVFR